MKQHVQVFFLCPLCSLLSFIYTYIITYSDEGFVSLKFFQNKKGKIKLSSLFKIFCYLCVLENGEIPESGSQPPSQPTYQYLYSPLITSAIFPRVK